MKKGIFIILPIVLFASVFFADTASAFGTVFGGMIVSEEAIPIMTRQAEGYVCFVPGMSMSISPVPILAGIPTDYFIPFSAMVRANTTLRYGAWTLGSYGSSVSISCINFAAGTTTTVSLPTVIIFGTSR